MKIFAINEARKPPRIGSIAIMSGTLLCAVATSVPAFSADLPDDYGRPRYSEYSPRYSEYSPRYTEYSRPAYYDRDCCCCSPRRYAPAAERGERGPSFEESRQSIERVPVAERHWVQRDYIERRYPARDSYPKSYRYSYYYPAPRSGEDREEFREPRYGGEYEYEAPPPRYAEPRSRELRPVYEYEPSPRSSYEYGPPRRPSYEYGPPPRRAYEPGLRPPAPVPSGYYYRPDYAE